MNPESAYDPRLNVPRGASQKAPESEQERTDEDPRGIGSQPRRQIIRGDANGLRSRVVVAGGKAAIRKTEEEQRTQTSGPREMNMAEFILLLMLGALCDIVSVLLEFVPVAGDLLEDLVVLPLLNYFLKKYEKKDGAKGRIIAMVVSGIIKIIPIVNIIPTYSMQVIYCYIKNRS